MSDTVRKHEAPNRHKQRGPVRGKESREASLKTHKQRRANDRARLRRDYR